MSAELGPIPEHSCPHCKTSLPGPHEDWCRETVPLAVRVKGYVMALYQIGYTPERAMACLTTEELKTVAEGPRRGES